MLLNELKRVSAAGTLLLVLMILFGMASGQAQDSEASASPQLVAQAQSYTGTAPRKLPGVFPGGADLPNGWRITPAGKSIATIGDLVLNIVSAPDDKSIIAVNSGFLPHALTVLDAQTYKPVQHIGLPSTWIGMAWSADGHTLYVAGGNASGAKNKNNPVAPIYEFTYQYGRLSEKPTGKLLESIDPTQVWWSGVAYLPGKNLVYAINRGTGTGPGYVAVFDAGRGTLLKRIPVDTTPYQMLLRPDGKYLFVTNWSSASVSVINTETNKVIRRLTVGSNPNDLKLSADGRLFVACANDNAVYVIDSRKFNVIERISTTLTPKAPEGSTPDALAIDDEHKLLYIANADNNSVAVADISNREQSKVLGFIPTGWYPSALLLTDHNSMLLIGNAKGESSYSDIGGPHSPPSLRRKGESLKSLQSSSIEMVSVAELKEKLSHWTEEVTKNTPYRDSQLSEALPAREPSVIPRRVGQGSPIKHIIYIIKENRTYDQEFGDLKGANGDPRLTIFGERVTPNQHALARQYVILDNLYCDGAVSEDGHPWSDAAYATDFNEKHWPANYAGRSISSQDVRAMVPASGFLWDEARKEGLTYRSYGEYASRVSTGITMEASPGATGLIGHVSPQYAHTHAIRDTDKVKLFLGEFKEYEANFDSKDPNKRLPNFIVMSMPDDHTMGTRPGWWTPQAMVADNDYAIGELVDAVSHSRYWPTTAIFIIEDDAQDGSDHVDARRTVGLVISPYVKRGIVDSTFYSTSSMIRSMELLLGLPPMSQFDASATPMYASFGTKPVVTQFNAIKPLVDIDAKNTKNSYGATESEKMDLSEDDHAPMHEFNEIIWKSVKGADSVMPAPVHRFRPLVDASESGDDNR